ncbi:LysE family translocator [Pendulispora albinea]|uniref:LysE family translocator n=1 Tax=Pendulispora albinea TaxID=2741071 RepID=A0ABZ2LT97_9BACT
MSGSSIFLFAATLGVAAASPGPSSMALVARVLGRGSRGTPMLCLGLMFGDVCWLTFAALGAAALAERFQPLFLGIKYAGVVYLLYLAYKLWATRREGGEPAGKTVPGEGVRLLFTGISMSLSNPKTMLFYLALLPSIVDLSKLTFLDLATLASVTMMVVAAVTGTYVVLAGHARRFFRSASALRAVDRVSAVVMAAAACVIALR